MTEAAKSEGENLKPRLDLLPFQELSEIAEVLGYGAGKFGDYNWMQGTRWSRYFAALLRHLFAWWSGEENDADTGKSHLAHAGCCLLFLMAYRRLHPDKDDRP